MKFISIDIETTGLDYNICQVLEIGAVVGDLTDTPVDQLPTFRTLIRHDKVVGEPFGLAMNADILYEIADKTRTDVASPGLAMMQLMDFVRANFGTKHATPAGKNFAGFDRAFLERLPGWQKIFKHRTLDPVMLFWRPGEDDELPSTAECMKRCGMTGPVTHRALDDARVVVELIRRGINPEYDLADDDWGL